MLLLEAILTALMIAGWIVLKVTGHDDQTYNLLAVVVIGHFFGVSTGTAVSAISASKSTPSPPTPTAIVSVKSDAA